MAAKNPVSIGGNSSIGCGNDGIAVRTKSNANSNHAIGNKSLAGVKLVSLWGIKSNQVVVVYYWTRDFPRDMVQILPE